MIIKAVITYDDGTEATFAGKPAVAEQVIPAQPAQPVDLSTIPTQSPAEVAEEVPVPQP